MDPFTAIGVAASIITFVDFSWSLVTGAKELHDSGRKTTKENARIRSITSDLQKYSDDLQLGGTGSSVHEQQLSSLAKECADLAKQLIAVLSGLSKAKNSRWESLKTTWASMRKQSEIADIERRLGEYRAQMNLRLLAILCIQNKANNLSSSSAAELAQLRQAVADILRGVQSHGASASGSDSDTEDEDSPDGNGEHSQRNANPRAPAFYYIRTREKGIVDPSEGTFEWILATQEESETSDLSLILYSHTLTVEEAGQRSRQVAADTWLHRMDDARRKLREWLKGDSSLFHISGRAGSGKSTLLKFLLCNKRAEQLLAEWAGQRTLIIASYFFWRSDGQPLQMSLDGFYRSILFTVLRTCPHMIPLVFPKQWQAMATASSTSMCLERELFDSSAVEEGYQALMQIPLQSGDYALCFFVDGLDEHNSRPLDRKKFAKQLLRWSEGSNIKICASSRPEIEFQDALSPASRIELHLLTRYDIFQSNRVKFEQSDVISRTREFYLDLVDKIADMAEGVFLWARLAVESLIEAAWISAERKRLEKKLEDTPSELDKVFEATLKSLSRSDRRMLNYYLLLMLRNPFPRPLNAMCIAWLKDLEVLAPDPQMSGSRYYSNRAVLEQLQAVQRHIQALSKGLLVVELDTSPAGGLGSCPVFFHCVRFFHRSARDYLDTASRREEFSRDFASFDPQRTHFLLRIAELGYVNQ
ncbi:hypothetical protein B0T19DRAFT_442090 [Cercophora scortea]|uniref:NACHT domain-containing protein n=1 Tax=Cercophora scortea TaxID=314031 RepID=A0AAE0MEJ4_9PEZI|nr:hypothetical protein B0T19DRAFT_442090 [Cercophora scortea]